MKNLLDQFLDEIVDNHEWRFGGSDYDRDKVRSLIASDRRLCGILAILRDRLPDDWDWFYASAWKYRLWELFCGKPWTERQFIKHPERMEILFYTGRKEVMYFDGSREDHNSIYVATSTWLEDILPAGESNYGHMVSIPYANPHLVDRIIKAIPSLEKASYQSFKQREMREQEQHKENQLPLDVEQHHEEMMREYG